MNISGSKKVKAPRTQVFTALLNPNVLQERFPGCESAEDSLIWLMGNSCS